MKDSVSQEEFEDTKGVIRIRKLTKDKQQNGQKEKNKVRNVTTGILITESSVKEHLIFC